MFAYKIRPELFFALNNIRALVKEFYQPSGWSDADRLSAAEIVGSTAINPFIQKVQVEEISTLELMEYLDTIFAILPDDSAFAEEVANQTICPTTTKLFDQELLDYWFKKIPVETARILGYY